MAKLLVGCGYLGLRVARLWKEAGEQVYVLTRSLDKAKTLGGEGFSAVVADINNLRDLEGNLFPAASISTVLYSVGYDRKSPQPIEQVYVGGLTNLLGCSSLNSAAAPMCRWIYISSTGVYGSADGDWVDEDTSPHPARDGEIGVKALASPPARGAWIETLQVAQTRPLVTSPPARGAWIETRCARGSKQGTESPPARGAWMEN